MGRGTPYGKVSVGDILYFIENIGDGLIKAAAGVDEVFNSKKLTKEESDELVENHQDQLMLDTGLAKRLSGKRYIELFTITNVEGLVPFTVDHSKYPKTEDWLLVEDMETV
jgi:hypothetical protein